MAILKTKHGSLHISEGNSKLGDTYNFSLAVGASCSKQACQTCLKKGCYARSLERRYPSVRKAWSENLSTIVACKRVNGNLDDINLTMMRWFEKVKPTSFRIHVGGDFFCKEYLQMWCSLAKMNPKCTFFGFTKQFDVVKGIRLPANLHLIASHWPGCNPPKWAMKRMSVAWLVEDGNPVPCRKGMTTYVCKGDCTKCHYCNKLTKSVGDVAFMKHR